MFRRVGKWVALATVGILAVGVVGLATVYAQGPNPSATPQVGCPAGGLGLRLGARWGGTMLETWANALGLQVQDLTSALRSGKTLADLAKEKGLTIDALVDKAMEARRAAVQQAVEAGRLTQAQADALLQQMRQRMTENLQSGACTPGTGRALGQGQGTCYGGRARVGRPGGMGRQFRQIAPSQQ